MTARLHVLLGGGGVGKTTLAAGYALALAEHGRRVGLLGIDPSRRLEDALGVHLGDLDAAVPAAGALRAAIVEPQHAIARWAAEASTDPAATARLAINPFFTAFGDRLASAIDILAAARLAEWRERDPALDDLVVDTAPGLAAIDFVRSPRQLAAMVEGRLVGWLRSASGGPSRVRHGAGRVLGAIGHLAGTAMLDDLAGFFAGVQAPLERMIARVETTRRWLADDGSALVLVTSPRDTGASGARELARALAAERLRPSAIVVNRAWPGALAESLIDLPAAAAPLAAYARALIGAQDAVVAAAAPLAPTLVLVPSHAMIEAGRRGTLAEVGRVLLGARAC